MFAMYAPYSTVAAATGCAGRKAWSMRSAVSNGNWPAPSSTLPSSVSRVGGFSRSTGGTLWM